jgi:hypothetical protein
VNLQLASINNPVKGIAVVAQIKLYIQEQRKQFYENNKDKISTKKKLDRITCECGEVALLILAVPEAKANEGAALMKKAQ